MNKGLEVLEAKWLFDVSQNKIEVVIHPQSVVHSMVAFRDGSVIAQLGIPDMKGAIAYALSHPERLPLKQSIPDFATLGGLTFQKPDVDKFPCLALAYQAADTGGTLPAVMNAANEVAVQAFLDQKISFVQIPEVIRHTMDRHDVVTTPDLSDIIGADKWARRQAGQTEMALSA
jgi:1-deoxy-D-xylulose-5-phosphate reductoisomerase